jgi:two-component system, response regulator FlrC
MALNILVVDDDLIIRQVVTRHLTLLGHAVDSASNGIEALRVIERKRFDIVVTDLQMPGMDGHELLMRLRQDQPLIRAIVMTSYVTMDAIMSCLRKGAFSFVTKPLGDCAELDRCIEQAAWVLADWRSQLVKLNRLKQGSDV